MAKTKLKWIAPLVAALCAAICALTLGGIFPARAAALTGWVRQGEGTVEAEVSGGNVVLTGEGTITSETAIDPYQGFATTLSFQGIPAEKDIDFTAFDADAKTAAEITAAFQALTADGGYYEAFINTEKDGSGDGFSAYYFLTPGNEKHQDSAVFLFPVRGGAFVTEKNAEQEDALLFKIVRGGVNHAFSKTHFFSTCFDGMDSSAEYGKTGNRWFIDSDSSTYNPAVSFSETMTPEGEKTALSAAYFGVKLAPDSNADAPLTVTVSETAYETQNEDWFTKSALTTFNEEDGGVNVREYALGDAVAGYKKPISVTPEKNAAVEIKFNQIPGFHNDNQDCWVALYLSRTPFNSSQGKNLPAPEDRSDDILLLLRLKSSSSIGGEGGYGAAYRNGTQIGPVYTNTAEYTMFELCEDENGFYIMINGNKVTSVPEWTEADTENVYLRFFFHKADSIENDTLWDVGFRVLPEDETPEYPLIENVNGWVRTSEESLFEEPGKAVRLVSKELHTYTYSARKYNVSQGVRVRFRFNTVPGYRSEDGGDYWLGIFLQDGTSNGLTGSNGFKYLVRPNAPADSDVEAKLEIDNSLYTGGNDRDYLQAFTSPYDVLESEHFITMKYIGTGFVLYFDNQLVSYSSVPEAMSLESMEEIQIVFNAYVNADLTGKFDITVYEPEQLSSLGGFSGLGLSDRAAYPSAEAPTGITVNEPKGAGKSGEKLSYGEKFNIQKGNVVEVKLSLDRIPGFYDPLVESYVAVTLSTKPDDLSEFSTKSITAVFTAKDRNTLIGSFGWGGAAAGGKYVEIPVSPMRDIVIKIGFSEDKYAAVFVNDVLAGYTDNVKQTNFALGAYLTVSSVNRSEDAETANWAYTVKSATSKAETIAAVGVPTEPEPESGDTENKALIIGLSVGIPVGVLLVAAGVVLFLMLRKKRNGGKESGVLNGGSEDQTMNQGESEEQRNEEDR